MLPPTVTSTQLERVSAHFEHIREHTPGNQKVLQDSGILKCCGGETNAETAGCNSWKVCGRNWGNPEIYSRGFPAIGNTECVYGAGFDMARVAEEYVSNLGEEEELIVAADVFGGSVANAFTEYVTGGKVHVVTGVNLPLLIVLVSSLDSEDTTEE